MRETTMRAFLRTEGEDLPSAKDGEAIWGTFGDEFFFFLFPKNMDGEEIWGTFGDAFRLCLVEGRLMGFRDVLSPQINRMWRSLVHVVPLPSMIVRW
jgi:hypothetical protein